MSWKLRRLDQRSQPGSSGGARKGRALHAALTKHLVDRYPHARRQIERTHVARQDRLGDKPIRESLVKIGRQSASLSPEDEHDATGITKWRVPEWSRGSGGQEPGLAQARQFVLELVPRRPDAQVYMFPVVEARALHLALVQREPEWLDQMQRRAGGEARATRIARVPMDLGMHEYDVKAQGQGLLCTRSSVLTLPVSIATEGSLMAIG